MGLFWSIPRPIYILMKVSVSSVGSFGNSSSPSRPSIDANGAPPRGATESMLAQINLEPGTHRRAFFIAHLRARNALRAETPIRSARFATRVIVGILAPPCGHAIESIGKVMLKTQSRQKLPQEASYPIGIEILNREFQRYATIPELEVSFRMVGGYAELRQIIETDQPHIILRADFGRLEKSLSIGNEPFWRKLLDGYWTLDIYPVRRNLKSRARESLIVDGLPSVAQWLTRAHNPIWFQSRHQCFVMFDPINGTVEFHEAVPSRKREKLGRYRAPIR